MAGMDMPDQRFQLVFGALGGKVGHLGFERTRQIGGGIDDVPAELEQRVRPSASGRGSRAGSGSSPTHSSV